MAPRIRIVLAALLAAAVAVAAGAAESRADPAAKARPVTEYTDPPGRAVDRPGDSKRAARRERIRERIRAMRAWYLTEQLSLDDVTAARLFPLLARFDDRLEAILRRGTQIRRALRAAMAAERPDGAAIDRMVDDLLGHYGDLYRVQQERVAAVRKVVTPVQGAKLVLLLPRIDEAIRKQLDRIAARSKDGRSDRSNGKRGRGRGKPATDADAEPPFGDPF